MTWRLTTAWLVRALILVPVILICPLMLALNDLDRWSWRVIAEHRVHQAQRRRAEVTSPEWPWT